MDNFFSIVPGWVWIVLGLCLAGLIVLAATALFTFLVKVGVVISEARKSPYSDAGDYRIEQGREVRPEQEGRASGRR